MGQWTGELSLDIEERKGKTVAKNVYFQGAFKVMRPVYLEDSGKVCYYLLNPGGGYLDGDRYRMKVSASTGSKVTLTTQSATKVYKTPKGYAYQETEIYLEKGSYLEFLPDPLIAYENANYRQYNTVRLETGATFLYTDILTPGWSPSGKKFTYHSVQLVNKIYVDGDLAVFDHIKLSPGEQNISGVGMMEGYSHIGSMIVIGEQTTKELLDELYEAILSQEADVKFGLSELVVSGLSIRILANSTQVIEKIINECHRIIHERWFGVTPNSLRKY
ncbi:urease accessory protein UreD [Planococcus sp. PAMC 21323]|uniref:urease accessory protein UreD n=1 Tax=Planococcus sp. PAMC 21323 TaxID=1526927 RepID=UPI0005720270|nr:urease accessory protein UreD [Planococcus sp. PAMC 21323]AIY06876.1 urease accessory protein UreD [Planococcus sp. PAMC 21323]